MIKRIIYFIVILAFSFGAKAQIEHSSLKEIESPNGQLKFQFYQKEVEGAVTQMYYQVSFNDQPVVLESELGILIENNLFESALGIENDSSKKWCENLELKSVDRDTVNKTWQPVYGERNLIKDNYNQLVLHFSKFDESAELVEGHFETGYDKRRSYKMDVIVRVYDEGVAFRYHFPETSNGLFLHIVGEQTSYTLPEETMAYYER
ncbi:glycoside hydrolase family 97 N-terminal domain-containing protein [Thalassobellus suaedae]|uniref:Glycoside hydrolase family 97 N-terminal domain-containing protein n=1 Tax=Thalassobellus suaedae TaxID=3074124 RepID=A0ABY9XX87_9FLAO|nr:glycoside hydrolase family 97 N-terminal domain-containing protein [Flavobacteriaceae bacterium HL-DH14]